MRELDVNYISKAVEDMCIDINHRLSADMEAAFVCASETESSELGKYVLLQLKENLKIADEEMIPICQDTGMAVVFLEIGQDVHFTGGDITAAVNDGVRNGYARGYLRKSVVEDPVERVNTKDNTPAVIHFRIVPGEQVKVTVAPKGFGSENMSRVFMLKPADGVDGIKAAVVQAVKDAGPNACPPMVLGIGIGGTFEKCALLAKEALVECDALRFIRPDTGTDAMGKEQAEAKGTGDPARDIRRNRAGDEKRNWVKDLERELYRELNTLGIGPAGLGGNTTVLALNVKTYPTHIAGLPVAVNICCHVNRHATRLI